MKGKRDYKNGKEAVNKIEDILGDIWRQIELMPFYNDSLEQLNKDYIKARDAAIAFGEDVSKYPKRVRWRTAGLEIVEGVRSL